MWCGSYPAHYRSKCPANNARCFKCSKLDHFKKICRNRAVKAIERKPNVEYSPQYEPCSSRENNYFLETAGNKNFDANKILTEVFANDVKMKFTIDTGADVTVVSNDTLKLFDEVELMPSPQILSGPQCDDLTVTGKFGAKLAAENCCSKSKQDVYVVKNLLQPLLGWPCNQSTAYFCQRKSGFRH